MKEKAEEEERLRNMRYFDTTNKGAFFEKSITENAVGREVMKT